MQPSDSIARKKDLDSRIQEQNQVLLSMFGKVSRQVMLKLKVLNPFGKVSIDVNLVFGLSKRPEVLLRKLP